MSKNHKWVPGLTRFSGGGFQATSMKAAVTKDVPVLAAWINIMADDEREVERDCVFEFEHEANSVKDRAVVEQISLEHNYVFYTENDCVEVVLNDDYVDDQRASGVVDETESSSDSIICGGETVRDSRDYRETECFPVCEVDSRDPVFDCTSGATACSFVGGTDNSVLVTDGRNVIEDSGNAGGETAGQFHFHGAVSSENESAKHNGFRSAVSQAAQSFPVAASVHDPMVGLATMSYPSPLHQVPATMEEPVLSGCPISYFIHPFVPYPVPVGFGVGGAVSPPCSQFSSQLFPPVDFAGHHSLGSPAQLLTPPSYGQAFDIHGESSNPSQVVFPVSIHGPSPSQMLFPIGAHGLSSNQVVFAIGAHGLCSNQVFLPSDRVFMPDSVHGQTMRHEADTRQKPKPWRRKKTKIITGGVENGIEKACKKLKCSRKRLADLQNIWAQGEVEALTRAQAEVDEMLGGVAGPKKPRKRGGRPKSAASKSGKGSASSSGTVAAGQETTQSKSKRSTEADATSKAG